MSSACSLFVISLREPSGTPAAAGRVVGPNLGQIQPHVDRRVPLAVRQHAEHRNLTIIDLAQPSRPLPGHPDRATGLLGEAALVDDQRARRLVAQKGVRVPADLRHDGLVIPRRLADEMLKLPRIAILNHGGHRFERAIFCLRKPTQIASRRLGVVSRARAEEMAVTVDESRERRRDPLDQRCG